MNTQKIFTLIALFVFSFSLTTNYDLNGPAPSKATSAQKPVILTDASFADEIKEGVVLVDFWATWCGPCRKQGPVVEALAAEFAGKVKVCKLDVDHNKQVAQKYIIRSIPTIIIFKDGHVVERLVGLRSKSELKKTLKIYL
jgi:thioredoxin 1